MGDESKPIGLGVADAHQGRADILPARLAVLGSRLDEHSLAGTDQRRLD